MKNNKICIVMLFSCIVAWVVLFACILWSKISSGSVWGWLIVITIMIYVIITIMDDFDDHYDNVFSDNEEES